MLSQQIRANSITDESILDLLNDTPRELFVPETYASLAFADMNIPLAHNQVMLRPLEEAQILSELTIHPTDTVLEIGTGTGYFTALLAKQAQHVDTIDIFTDFSEHAKTKLTHLNINNVTFMTGDASKGWPNQKQYNVIVLTGSVPLLPKSYLEQLQLGGRLFAIIGTLPIMTATLFIRQQTQQWQHKNWFETVVPPLMHAPIPNPFMF